MTDVGGRTTKQTYVTKYTTDVDPRTLPDFKSRGVVTEDSWQHNQQIRDSLYHQQQPQPQRRQAGERALTAAAAPPPPHRRHTQSPSYSASPTSSMTDDITEDGSTTTNGGHRLRKKYTTTTVTTVTTTTILLPKMQEAYVFPSMTSHQMDQQAHPYAAVTNGRTCEVEQPQLSRQQLQLQGRMNQIASSNTSTNTSSDLQRHLQTSSQQNHRPVPMQTSYDPDGNNTQAWVFHQQTANEVTTEENRGRLPTLEELGITSYFANNGTATQPRRTAPYAQASLRSKGQQQQQPWIAAETRHEVEGGKRYY